MDDSEGQDTWRKLEMVTSGLAQDLCEQLRLILEPSQASRLRVWHLKNMYLFFLAESDGNLVSFRFGV